MPGDADVEVSYAFPDALEDESRREAALALLAPEERERVARFHFERDRLLHLAARALLRRCLSRRAPVPPAAWRFEASAHGRPEIASPACELRFSVSHTRGLAMVAVVARHDVGADVERVPEAVPLDVVERLFTPAERDALRAAPAAEQPARFAELWTMKEAYAKARGLGLSLPLETIGFALHPPRLVAGDDPSSWQVESTAPTALHRAAVSVRRADAEPLRVVTRWQDA